jgi:hypothetical protein
MVALAMAIATATEDAPVEDDFVTERVLAL